MPFAIAGLGDLLFCVLCLAIAAALLTIGKFAGALIPNVPVIGSAIRDGVTNAVSSAGDFFINLTKGSWSRLTQLVLDAVWLGKAWAQGTVDAISHAIDIAFHVGVNLANTAVSLQNNIDHAVAVTVPTLIGNAVSAVEGDLTHTATSLQNNIDRVVSTDIPQAVDDAKAVLNSELQTVETNLQNNINNLSGNVTAALSSVWSAIDPLQTAVSSTIPAAIASTASTAAAQSKQVADTAQANLVSTAQALQSNLDAVQGQLQSSIAAESAAQSALAAADLTTAEGRADADAAQATITAEQTSQASLTAAVATINGQLSDVTKQLQTLEATQTITLPPLADVTVPGTITVPVAVGALAAAVAGVITEVDNCMVTACEGPNNWKNLLSGALGVLDFAEIAAFLAAAYADPKGEGDLVAVGAGDLYSAGHALIDGILSL